MTHIPPSSEPPNLQGQYAGFASRMFAFVIDRAILIVIIAIINLTISLVLSFFGLSLQDILNPADTQTTFITMLRISLILIGIGINVIFYWGYFILFWTLIGQTPGKILMGVRVISTNGRPLSIWQSVRRLVGYWIAMIPLFMGFIWVLVSDTRQGWHDKIARSYVIYTWEARSSFQFLNSLTRLAEKRATAYERKTPDSLTAQIEEDTAETDDG
ncbi:MAG: RDD family protein [Chloroflexi bacterium]|nr:RDD family protein [Chloroflexota bacterium]